MLQILIPSILSSVIVLHARILHIIFEPIPAARILHQSLLSKHSIIESVMLRQPADAPRLPPFNKLGQAGPILAQGVLRHASKVAHLRQEETN